MPAGGQFATSARDAADGVGLTEPDYTAQILHERLTRGLGVDNHTRYVARFEDVTSNSLTFVEATYGDTETRYDVRFDHGAITVRDETTDAFYESYQFRLDDRNIETSAADIMKAIGQCRDARRDIVAANEVFARLEHGVVSRDLDAGIASVDLGDGRLPVVLGPYATTDDGFDETHLRVNVGGTPYQLTPSNGYDHLPVVTRDDDLDVDEDEAAAVLDRVGAAIGRDASRTPNLLASLLIARRRHP